MRRFIAAFPLFSFPKFGGTGARNDTIHTNPKRKRGNELPPSLTHRISVTLSRAKYNSKGLRPTKAVMNYRTPSRKRRQAAAPQRAANNSTSVPGSGTGSTALVACDAANVATLSAGPLGSKMNVPPGAHGQVRLGGKGAGVGDVHRAGVDVRPAAVGIVRAAKDQLAPAVPCQRQGPPGPSSEMLPEISRVAVVGLGDDQVSACDLPAGPRSYACR